MSEKITVIKKHSEHADYLVSRFDEGSKAQNYSLQRLDFIARDSIYAKRAYAIAPSVRLSVCLSVTRVIHAKTVVVRIVQFSPYSSPIPLAFAR